MAKPEVALQETRSGIASYPNHAMKAPKDLCASGFRLLPILPGHFWKCWNGIGPGNGSVGALTAGADGWENSSLPAPR